MKPSERIQEIADSNAAHNPDGTPIIGPDYDSACDRLLAATLQYLDEQSRS
jgi:hypothetical protein